jgi:hypothetical protein
VSIGKRNETLQIQNKAATILGEKSNLKSIPSFICSYVQEHAALFSQAAWRPALSPIDHST